MSLILLCVEHKTKIELIVDGVEEQEVFINLVYYLEDELSVADSQ